MGGPSVGRPPLPTTDARALEEIARNVNGSFQTAESLAQSFIREAIMRGAYAPGHRINLDEIASALDISRMPVRAGLRQLEAEGLVRIHPRRGATVSVLNPAEIAEIYDILMMLETYLFDLAAPSITPAVVARLRAIAEEGARSEDLVEQLALRRRYYATMYELADRPQALALVDTLRSSVGRYLSMQRVDQDPAHTALLDLLDAGDLKAARKWLTQHLQAVSKRLQDRVSQVPSAKTPASGAS
jgi:DNA-binding GntR family transcriptional regulator